MWTTKIRQKRRNIQVLFYIIEGLQNQQSLNKFQLNQYIAGLTPAQGLRCHRYIALRIKEFVED